MTPMRNPAGRHAGRAPPRALIVVVIAMAAILGIAAASWLAIPRTVAMSSGTLLDKPRPVAEFSLVRSDGSAWSRKDLLGRWTLLDIGYTTCPDVCPTTLTALKQMRALLGADASRLDVVFLSVDPQRDTPQKLGVYVHYFDPAFIGVTGDTAALEQLGTNLGFVFDKVPGPTPESYLMDHSAALMLIDPQGRLAAYLTPPFQPQALAGDIGNVLRTRS